MHRHASLNRTFRLVWNHAQSAWKVAPESAKGQGKASGTIKAAGVSGGLSLVPRRLRLAILAGLGLMAASPWAFALDAQALPTGGQVTQGQAHLGQQGATLTIDQASQRAVIDWQGFDVGKDAQVRFNQPNAQAATLNRVTGGSRSQILGRLDANGQVYLVNGAGVLFGQSAQVNVGGIVASTLNISDQDFLAGKDRFTLTENSTGEVVNQGSITAKGGKAVLLGKTVRNEGTINTEGGNTVLAAGKEITFAAGANGHLNLAVDASELQVAVHNGGAIQADGGQIVLNAQGANALAAAVVSNTGSLQARSIAQQDGRILLSADAAQGGKVQVAGSLDASNAQGQGGQISVTGQTVALTQARLDASGATGGGTLKVGGDWQGRAGTDRAKATTIDAVSTLKADAAQSGNGGTVVVWSDERTDFAGQISARGKGQGRGGNAEVSGKAVLSYTGFADLSADSGRFGTLLLDPYNVTISNGTDTNPSGFAATGNDSVLNATTLTTALGSANVTVSTGAAGSVGSQAGNITLVAATPLTWNTGATLTLQAAGAVTLNSALTAQAGGLRIEAGTSAPSTATSDLSVARFTLASGNWVQNAAMLPGFATADFQITGGSFLRAAGGSGTVASPYQLADIYGVQGMGTSAALLAANYRLIDNIDASGTVTWNGGSGFSPVGTGNTTFTGNLDGAGHTISRLTINRPSADMVAPFRGGHGGRISNLGLIDGSIVGHDYVGGLVDNNAGTIDNVYNTGTVTGRRFVGGLISTTFTQAVNGVEPVSLLSNSYTTGAVTSTEFAGAYVGGLIGDNRGSVVNSHATGPVIGTSTVGGLIGRNSGTVSNSYATGSVTGAVPEIGGLIGNNTGTVNNAYATGIVVQTGSSTHGPGGLVGSNSGTLTNTYWDTQTTGQANGVGSGSSAGATGLATAQARTGSTYTGFDFGSVWYQAGDLRPILRSEAAAADASGVIAVSNLHQLQLMGANPAGSYRLAANLEASATNAMAASPGVWGEGGFVPVGRNYSTPFTGSLDGAGRTITGLTIARPSEGYIGLIGYLGGSVSGLGLVEGSVKGFNQVGGLVGYNVGTVSHSYVSGSVSGSGDYVGGLVGYSDGTVSHSYVSGSVSGSGSYVGGLVGWNTGTISQSYVSGRVSGRYDVGGLAGFNSSGTLTNAYWDKDTTGQANGIGTGSATGATGLTSAQARTASSYTGFDFGTVWYQAGDMRPILRAEAATPDAGGVIAVSNLHQLQLMGANLAGSYRLTRDLDASATNATATSPGIWGAGGFVPVTVSRGFMSSGLPWFTGSLDGADHTITGLTIVRPSQDNVGLISYLGAGGRVSGLGLVGGSVSGNSSVGSFVGYSDGTVSQSYTSASVSGSGTSVGGLVGQSNGTVSQSYASGSVSGSVFSGGLVGNNTGTVSQSYASGSVTASNAVGGLIGYNDNGGSVSQSYASGRVSGNNDVGGLVGNNSGTLTNAYWDTQATGRANSVGSGTGSATSVIGLTTAQMQDLSSFGTTYAGFDFAGTWVPPNQAGQDGQTSAAYPQLYSLSRAVTVTAGANSRAYGDANPVLTYRGLRPGAFVTTLGTLATTATQASGVGAYGYTLTGTTVTDPGGTYRILALPGTLTVTPRAITVAADAHRRAYGDANPALTYAVGGAGLVAGDRLTGDLATAADGRSNIGSYAIGQGTLAASPNYALTYQGANLIVGQRVVTLEGTRTYDGTADIAGGLLTAGNLVNGDTVTLSGSGMLTGKDVGSRALADVSGLTLSNSNYRLSGATGAVTISPAPLTVMDLNGVDKTYDGTTKATLSGTARITALAGDTVVLTGIGTGFFADKNAGSNKAVTVTGYSLGGADAGNYVLVQPRDLTASIQQADLAVLDVGAADKTYDGTTTATLTGTARVAALAGDNVALIGSGTGSFADKNAGHNKAVAISGYRLDGTDASNYRLLMPAAITADIAPRALTVSSDNASKTYGDADPTLGWHVTQGSLLSGDSLTGTVTRQRGENAGTYQINADGLRNGNYLISVQNGSFTIDPRAITVTANDVRKIYGDADPTFGWRVTQGSLVSGDSLSGSITRQAGENVGTYALDASGLRNGNYLISVQNGTFTIDPRAITVATSDARKAYGDADPALGWRVTQGSLVSGDTLIGSITRQAGESVGTYALNASGLRNGNYLISVQNGSFTIDPRTITVTANDARKIYGDADPALGWRVTEGSLVSGDSLTGSVTRQAGESVGTYALDASGLRNGNYLIRVQNGALTIDPRPITITVNSASKTYGDTDPALNWRITEGSLVSGDSLTGSLTRLAGENVGTYQVDASGLRNGNYLVTVQGGSFTIHPRAITVTANDARKTYGDTDPALNWRITEGSLLSGDSLTGTVTRQRGENAGTYQINADGLRNGNYLISVQNGSFTIDPRAITVTTNDARKIYGDADPALGWRVTQGSLVSGDSLSGSITRQAGENVGTYQINADGLRNGNYLISVQNGALMITKARVRVTANDDSRVADGKPYQGGNGVTYTGFVRGEGPGVLGGDLLYGGSAQGAVTPGIYAISLSGLSAANYEVGYEEGRLLLRATPEPSAPLARVAPGAGQIDRDLREALLAEQARLRASGPIGEDAKSAPGLPLRLAEDYIRL